MKKIGVLLLVLVVALGALGIGYAAWQDSLSVGTTVNTGKLDVTFWQYTPVDIPILGMDTTRYVSTTPGFRLLNADEHSFTVSNMYPGAEAWVEYSAVNRGTIPAKVVDLDVTGAPAWLHVATFSPGVPQEVKDATIAAINASEELSQSDKDEIIASVGADWQKGDILGTGILNRVGVLFIHLTADPATTPENSGTATIQVVSTFSQTGAPLQ